MNEIPKKTKKFFKEYAANFDKLYDIEQKGGVKWWINKKLRASMFERFNRTFEELGSLENNSVIDVGCGSGRYSAMSLMLGADRVVGVDLSEEMLVIAVNNLKEMEINPEKFHFICGNFQSLKIDEKFDYAIVMGVMDYIPEPEEFLRKLKHIVRKKAVISFPVSEDIWKWQRKIRYIIRRCPLYFYNAVQLENTLRNAGINHYLIERMHRDYFIIVNI